MLTDIMVPRAHALFIQIAGKSYQAAIYMPGSLIRRLYYRAFVVAQYPRDTFVAPCVSARNLKLFIPHQQ